MSEFRPNETGRTQQRESLWDSSATRRAAADGTGAQNGLSDSSTRRRAVSGNAGAQGGLSDSSARRRAVTGNAAAQGGLSDSSIRRRAMAGNAAATPGSSDSNIRRRAMAGSAGMAPELSDSGIRRRAAAGTAAPGISDSSTRRRAVSQAARPAGQGAQRTAAGTRARPPQARRPAGGDVFMERRTAMRRNRGSLAVTFILSLCIVLIGVMILRQHFNYNAYRAMAAVVDQHNYFEGVTIEGMDVTTLTLDQTLAYWEQNVEPQYYNRTIMLTSGEYYTARELGYSSDYATVISNAWNAGRRGTLAERYDAITERRASQSVDYPVTRTMASLDRVEASVAWVAEAVNKEPVSASIQGFDVEHRTFVFNESVNGVEVDEETLLTRITQALEAGGGTVEVPIHDVLPEITTQDVSSRYGLIASAVTDASSSDPNRLDNVKLALSKINGLWVEPGGKFSFNNTIGERTEEAGFKIAHAYGDGFIIDEVGGGICQVSTTLFNAVVKADLKVTERHPHSMPVAYVDKGKDAAVNWRSKDFCFTNNSDDRIYIVAYVNSSNRVKIGIYGRLLDDGQVITVEAETLQTTEYQTEYRLNEELAPGQQVVYREGREGYYAEAYKVVTDALGNEVSRKLLCKSTYNPVNEIIDVGPEIAS